MDKHIKYRCACCGYYTLEEGKGNYEICPVCFWEADSLQEREMDCADGANRVCLIQARENFAECGASEERFKDLTREPLPEEMDNADYL